MHTIQIPILKPIVKGNKIHFVIEQNHLESQGSITKKESNFHELPVATKLIA